MAEGYTDSTLLEPNLGYNAIFGRLVYDLGPYVRAYLSAFGRTEETLKHCRGLLVPAKAGEPVAPGFPLSRERAQFTRGIAAI